MAKIFKLIAFVAVAVASSAQAAVSISGPSAYLQSFDSLASTTGTSFSALPEGWVILEGGGGARDNELYAVDTGGSTTGDTYSYGAAGSTDRALGALRSGTLFPSFGASFQNSGATAISSLTIGYTGEQWRLGTAGRADRLNFEYSTDATSLTTGTWTNVASLAFATPTILTTGAKDGNLAANRSVLSSSISGLSIAGGSSFWIRYVDFDASGADDGLAVDNFNLSATFAPAAPVPEPGEWAMMLAGGAIVARIAKRRAKTTAA